MTNPDLVLTMAMCRVLKRILARAKPVAADPRRAL